VSGIAGVDPELVSVVDAVEALEAVDGAVLVTDSSLVGKSVPFALTGAEDVTTALSVVGKSGGALGDAFGEGEDPAVCGSGFSGSDGAADSVFSEGGCCAFTCC
jgi:hypothetical protein